MKFLHGFWLLCFQKSLYLQSFRNKTTYHGLLKARTGISSMEELKAAVAEKLREVDMEMKCRDFVHLLFNERNADRIRQFPEVMSAL